ncbi:hypothetical protein C8A03DRAFT_29656 [Achaetomium macrosporum]|uniref:Uncharacterized protein n=1 Tax=Achaetomium macrosporum TaxID=79813 RepID=A0AAN7CK11_9PEZI|nr:hypothetical protein C8A03DRAFT_29656 [Achaetomium macrosporum]
MSRGKAAGSSAEPPVPVADSSSRRSSRPSSRRAPSPAGESIELCELSSVVVSSPSPAETSTPPTTASSLSPAPSPSESSSALTGVSADPAELAGLVVDDDPEPRRWRVATFLSAVAVRLRRNQARPVDGKPGVIDGNREYRAELRRRRLQKLEDSLWQGGDSASAVSALGADFVAGLCLTPTPQDRPLGYHCWESGFFPRGAIEFALAGPTDGRPTYQTVSAPPSLPALPREAHVPRMSAKARGKLPVGGRRIYELCASPASSPQLPTEPHVRSVSAKARGRQPVRGRRVNDQLWASPVRPPWESD